MTYIFRKINEADFPKLIKLFNEFSEFEKTPEKMLNSIERMKKEQEYVNGFVAITNNDIIAYVTYFFTYHTWIGKSLYMDDLYVKPNYRNNKIGGKLLDLVISQGREANCRKLRWQVSNWNEKAQEFYKRIGAEIDDVEINCELKL